MQLITDDLENKIRQANPRPDAIELYDKRVCSYGYENTFDGKIGIFDKKKMTFKVFYDKLNANLPEDLFLGRPNYNWLVADGIFKPFEGIVGAADMAHEPFINYNIIPIYKPLDHGKTWLYIANFVYVPFAANPQQEPISVMQQNDAAKGWKIAWTLLGNDGSVFLHKYTTQIRDLLVDATTIGRPIYGGMWPDENGPVITTITHTQFVTE